MGFDTGPKSPGAGVNLKKVAFNKYGVPILKFDDCLTNWELFPESALGQSVLMSLHTY